MSESKFDMLDETVLEEDDHFHEAEEDERQVDYGTMVVVNVGALKFTMSVGEGNQDIRWLTLVAAQRYSMYVQAHGKQRQREEALLDAGNFLPIGCSFNGKQCPATTKIADVLKKRSRKGGESKEDPEFDVELCYQVRLGEDGAPELQEWKSTAFCHSEAGKVHVQAQREKLSKGNDVQDVKELDEDDDDEDGSRKYAAPGYSFYFDGPEQTASAFESDWAKVRQFEDFEKWFYTAEYRKLDADKEHDIKNALLDSFESLCSLLDFYSWHWRRSEQFAVNLPELKHLLHQSSLLDLSSTNSAENADYQLFQDCLGKLRAFKKTDVNGKQEELFSRYEFILILLMVACEQHSKAQLAPNEVSRILAERIEPAAVALTDKGSIVRRVLGKSHVARIFRGRGKRDYHLCDIVHRGFEQFCIQANSTREPSSTMTLREFALFCSDIMPGKTNNQRDDEESNEEKEGKSTDEIMDSLRFSKLLFHQAQQLAAKSPLPMLPEMILTEFVYAILLLLYEREEEPDTWDSRYGARKFLLTLENIEEQIPTD